MQLWRLSSARRAADFSGGYGLVNSGRWNSAGRPVTYSATVPSLAALEKRVHVKDPTVLPPLVLVEYEVPDDVPMRKINIADLSHDWMIREIDTQRIGDQWLDSVAETLLFVPSVIVPIASAPERNVLINHRHARASAIKFASRSDFTLDPRLFSP